MSSTIKAGDKIALANGTPVVVAEIVGPDTAIVFGKHNYSAVTSLVGAVLIASEVA